MADVEVKAEEPVQEQEARPAEEENNEEVGSIALHTNT